MARKKNGEVMECYSYPLYKFISKHGIRPFGGYTHKETKAKCKLYIMSDELSAVLDKWSKTKPR